MAQLKWDQTGSRFFEAGIDRGVLYPKNKSGVAWNGLVSVSENPSGGEATPYYSDGIKYLNLSSKEEFGGTIEAYTYPDEFAVCDGTAFYGGVGVHQQNREEFDFSYRTLIGNDLDGTEFGYKLHIIYNALVTPSQKDYESLTDDPEASTFSWEFTTRANTDIPRDIATPLSGVSVNASISWSKLEPFSHLTIDSRRVSKVEMRYVEEILYGTSKTAPRVPTLTELYDTILMAPGLVVTDNGNGTWTATGKEHEIQMVSDTEFKIDSPTATLIDKVSYKLSTAV